MAKLILVRHGETEWNKSLRYQGQSDIRLNEKGIEQAARVRERLSPEKIDVIYSSDLVRAHETAEIIAARHSILEICQSPLLRETNFGEAEGLTFGEIKDRYPQITDDLQSWRTRSPELHFPGGESIIQLAARVGQFVGQLKDHKPEETVLVVAHGGSLQVLICLLLGIDLNHWFQMRLSNASVTVMDISPYLAVLVGLNDTCHIR